MERRGPADWAGIIPTDVDLAAVPQTLHKRGTQQLPIEAYLSLISPTLPDVGRGAVRARKRGPYWAWNWRGRNTPRNVPGMQSPTREVADIFIFPAIARIPDRKYTI